MKSIAASVQPTKQAQKVRRSEAFMSRKNAPRLVSPPATGAAVVFMLLMRLSLVCRAMPASFVVQSGVVKGLRHLCRDRGHREIEVARSEEHTSELQSLMRNSYAVF